MTQTAHVVDGTVREILVPPAGLEIDAIYPAAMLADCVAVGDDVRTGWTTPDGGKTFSPPAPVRDGGSGVRSATTYQLMSAFTDAQRAAYPGPIKAWDQRMFSARDTPWPESNEKIGRIAVALGTSPAAWFDAALNPATA